MHSIKGYIYIIAIWLVKSHYKAYERFHCSHLVALKLLLTPVCHDTTHPIIRLLRCERSGIERATGVINCLSGGDEGGWKMPGLVIDWQGFWKTTKHWALSAVRNRDPRPSTARAGPNITEVSEDGESKMNFVLEIHQDLKQVNEVVG